MKKSLLLSAAILTLGGSALSAAIVTPNLFKDTVVSAQENDENTEEGTEEAAEDTSGAETDENQGSSEEGQKENTESSEKEAGEDTGQEGAESQASEEDAPESEASQGEEAPAGEDEASAEKGTEEAAPAENSVEASSVLKFGYAAPHGDRAFASVAVVLEGDVIVDAVIDEYQFLNPEENVGVPNSDDAFAEGFAEDTVLASKRENNEQYSAKMAEAGSTVSYADNMDAIQDFASGKTIAEVEAAIAEVQGLEEGDSISDVVSGATFVDTAGYLQAIVDVAKDGFEFDALTTENVDIKQTLQAPHGTKAFAIVVTVLDGETIVAAAIDELQFLAEGEGVPGSDGTFGESVAEGVVLASKLINNEGYSENMAQAGSTVSYADNIRAITDFATGKTAEEVEAAAEEVAGLGEGDNISDVISGATFVDTAGYLQAIADTARD